MVTTIAIKLCITFLIHCDNDDYDDDHHDMTHTNALQCHHNPDLHQCCTRLSKSPMMIIK